MQNEPLHRPTMGLLTWIVRAIGLGLCAGCLVYGAFLGVIAGNETARALAEKALDQMDIPEMDPTGMMRETR